MHRRASISSSSGPRTASRCASTTSSSAATSATASSGSSGRRRRGLNGHAFKVVGDYKEVIVAGRSFHLGACQAEVVRLLHEAAKTEEPWRYGKAVLAAAGSSCTRMADLFKSQRHWRELIASDGRGHYRLAIPLRPSR